MMKGGPDPAEIRVRQALSLVHARPLGVQLESLGIASAPANERIRE